MNGVPKRSSQCQWNDAPDRGLGIARSLDPVAKIAIITPNAHKIASYGARREATLAQILESGAQIALSEPPNDSHTVMLVRNGKVWIFLTPESFYKAGLEAKKHGSKYLAVYDTRIPGKRLDRFKWALENTLTTEHTFLVATTTPTDQEQTIDPQNLLIPPFYSPPNAPKSDGIDEAFNDWAIEFTEWAGLAVVSPHLLAGGNEPVVDQAICDNYVPESVELRSAAVSLTKGVFTADQVERTWSELIAHEWAVMSVQGFQQMPVSRSEKPREHGEIGYTLIKDADRVSVLRYTN